MNLIKRNGKGSNRRPYNPKKYADRFEQINWGKPKAKKKP